MDSYMKIEQDTGKICNKPTTSTFTNCTAILIYNKDSKECLYLHASPMFGHNVISRKKDMIKEFVQSNGEKYAWIFGRMINNTSFVVSQCEEYKIPIKKIKLEITDKLRNFRNLSNIDLAWFLNVSPEEGKCILDDKAQDEPVEYFLYEIDK